MNDPLDSLIDTLLREKLGNEHPPDLMERILHEADRRLKPRRRILAASLASAAVLLLAFAGWLWLQEPRRGSILQTDEKPRRLNLGGYCNLRMEPHTVLKLEGEPKAEAIVLERGGLACQVDPGGGSFSVKTGLGTVSVKGTRFTVRMDGTGLLVRIQEGSVWLGTGSGRHLLEKGRVEEGGVWIGKITEIQGDVIAVKIEGEPGARLVTPPDLDEMTLQAFKTFEIGSAVELDWVLDGSRQIRSIRTAK